MSNKQKIVSGLVEVNKSHSQKRKCDAPGCLKEGVFPAPRSRQKLTEYLWFCLEHIRVYNRSWNFYEGMSDADVEKQVRHDITWERPTWPCSGKLRDNHPNFDMGIFSRKNWDQHELSYTTTNTSGWRPRPNSDQEKALKELSLQGLVTRDIVKAQYKNLAKKYHPDTKGGDKSAEERLKRVNNAYSLLMSCEELI